MMWLSIASIARWRMVEPVALTALAIDAALGWPPRLYARIGHPVGGFARAIGGLERRWNRPTLPPARRRLLGLVAMLLIIGGTIAVGVLIERLAHEVLGRWAWTVIALFAWPAIAARSLYDHVRPISAALQAQDLPAAHRAVAMIVGRDTGALDETGVARAGIESLAESFCDGIVAPLFWLLILGLPGVWAYKAINTADSLIGHPEERWRAFGWAAARIDDAANWIPARIAGPVLCLTGGGGWRVLWRDCRKHASPNAGWPEAAMAGALGVALAGPVSYDNMMHSKAWIGAGGRQATDADLRRALAIYVRACILLGVIAGGIAWLR